MNHAHAMAKERRGVPSEIEDATPGGNEARQKFGRAIYDLNVQQYCCGGLNFGYYYDASPVIAYDGVPHPAYTMADFTPSTVPGCRTPHLWLADGRSLYDAVGPDYTLLRFDLAADPVPLLDAAGAARRSDPALRCGGRRHASRGLSRVIRAVAAGLPRRLARRSRPGRSAGADRHHQGCAGAPAQSGRNA